MSPSETMVKLALENPKFFDYAVSGIEKEIEDKKKEIAELRKQKAELIRSKPKTARGIKFSASMKKRHEAKKKAAKKRARRQ